MLVKFSHIIENVSTLETEDVRKLNNSLHILNCTLTLKTNTMTLDKITDKRIELFNSSLTRLSNIIQSQNYQVEKMMDNIDHEVALKFLSKEFDQANTLLVQNTLLLITNLIDGLIKPEDSNHIDFNIYIKTLEDLYNINSIHNL